MTSKQKKPQETFSRAEFSKRLPTLLLNEVMKLKFKENNKSKWESMVVCRDQMKKQYFCNVCKVFQYGDKNLIQHLSGKKHFIKMESVKEVYSPKETGDKIAEKEDTHSKKHEESNIINNELTKEVTCDLTKSHVIRTKEATKSLIKKPVLNNVIAAKSTDTIASKTECSLATTIAKPNSEVAIMNSKSSVVQKALLAHDKEEIVASDQTKSKIQPVIENQTDSTSQIDILNRATKQTLPQTKVGLSQSECSTKKCNSDLKNPKTLLTNLKKGNIQNNKAEVLDCKLKSSPQPNVVINPLALRNAKQTKISCVPISKLISAKQLKQKTNQNTIDIKPAKTATEPHKKDNISKQKEDALNKIDLTTQMSETENENTSCANYTPTKSVSQSFTFESAPTKGEVIGLLGVEYVIKIVKNMKDNSPRFQCSLCGITADEISMQNHLLGYNHRLKYCEKHFPTAIRHYRQYIANIPKESIFKVLSPILEKLAKAIEKHHGRETTYLCYEYSFTKNSANIVSTVFNRKHASEVQGPSFTHILNSKDVEMLIANANKSKFNTTNDVIVIDDSSPNLSCNNINLFAYQNCNAYNPNYPQLHETKRIDTVDDETHKRMVDIFLRDTRRTQHIRHRSPIRNLKRSRSKSSSSERKRIRSIPLMTSQWDIERKSLSPLREGDIWQAYRHLVDQSVRELNASFDLYISDPEQHPFYNDEWQKFWKRRKDQLVAAGINHRTYNYQNEWILFFNARLEELYKKDIENIKIKCRERLCLPMTNVELSNSKYHVQITDNNLNYVSPKATGDYDQTNTLKDHMTNIQNAASENIALTTAKNVDKTGHIKVIHVLRLLTALEDHLGSLGPSITELLAKALQMFKIQPDKAESLLLTSDNCAILETAKEKFTGLVISKILEPPQERAVKKAIYDTEQLLQYAANMQTELGKSKVELNNNFVVPQQNYLKCVNTKNVYKTTDRLDKAELAAKLASSLISQGKTKINKEQLQQIVQVYSLIEQQKQDTTLSSRPINVNGSSPVLTFQPSTNKSPPEKSNLNYNYSQTTFSQTQNLNYDAAYSTSHSDFPNSDHVSGTHRIITGNNYFSANMACSNNKTVQNFNQMEFPPSGQEAQCHQFDWKYFDIGDQTDSNVFKNKWNT